MVGGANEGEDQTAAVMTALRDFAAGLSLRGIQLKEITLSFTEAPAAELQVLSHRVEDVLEDPDFTVPVHPGLQGVFALFDEDDEA